MMPQGFGPKNALPQPCAKCGALVPSALLSRCPTCGHELGKPGDVGSAVVDAMTDVLSGGPPEKKKKSSRGRR